MLWSWLGAALLVLLVLYVLTHYLFVSQSSQVLALFGVFVEVGLRAGVPAFCLLVFLVLGTPWLFLVVP